MENKFLIDLSIKYGLNSAQVSKVADMVYQSGTTDMDSRQFQRVAKYICEAGLVDDSAEEVIEELKLKGLIRE